MKNVGTWYRQGIAAGVDGSGGGGSGVEQSMTKARKWWVKAAEKGDENAMVCIEMFWMKVARLKCKKCNCKIELVTNPNHY